jgi:transposase
MAIKKGLPILNIENHKCDYCMERIARYMFLNKKLCCEEWFQNCPKKREKQTLKMKNTKIYQSNKINLDTGLSILQEQALYRAKLMKNTIDLHSGLTIDQIRINNRKETMMKVDDTGLTGFQRAAILYNKNLKNDIDLDTGLSKLQIKNRKGGFTKRHTIDEVTGLNISQLALLKRKEDSLGIKSSWLVHPNLEFKVQGTYEYKFVDIMISKYGLDYIKQNLKRGPIFHYIHPILQKKKIYLSDFQLNNCVFEIKSSYTWNKVGKDLILEQINKTKLEIIRNSNYIPVLVLDHEFIYV